MCLFADVAGARARACFMLLYNAMRKQVVVIAGPSGSGKNSIMEGVLARCANCTRLVTATTRAPREGERDTHDYYFMNTDRFLAEVRSGTIPEHWHAPQTDRYYGTYLPDLERKIAAGQIVVTVLQLQGAQYFKEHFDATTIFVLPDSLDDLEQRIKARQDIAPAALQERLDIARKEVTHEASFYDYRIKNEHGKLDQAIEDVLAIMRKEGFAV